MRRTFMLLLDITIVNVALPAIEKALRASFSELQWVVGAVLAVLLVRGKDFIASGPPPAETQAP